jgi:hypothetical protein
MPRHSIDPVAVALVTKVRLDLSQTPERRLQFAVTATPAHAAQALEYIRDCYDEAGLAITGELIAPARPTRRTDNGGETLIAARFAIVPAKIGDIEDCFILAKHIAAGNLHPVSGYHVNSIINHAMRKHGGSYTFG